MIDAAIHTTYYLRSEVASEVREPKSIAGDRPGLITDVTSPTLTVWPASAKSATRTGVIICPGGGYRLLAVAHEGDAVAAWLNTVGVTAFVLHYRVPAPGYPAPLHDVRAAVQFVRSRAGEFGVEANRIGVLGFSAGGHLAASAGTLHDEPDLKEGADRGGRVRPDFMVLLYPLITMTEPWGHTECRRNLLGENPAPGLPEKLSLERRVTSTAPPAFIVHTADDAVVPVQNSLVFFSALRAAGVPAELHVYEHGAHGFGLGQDMTGVGDWPKRCEAWMRSHGWLDRF